MSVTSMLNPRSLLRTALLGSALALLPTLAFAQEEDHAPQPPRQKWSFAGVFGTYDQAQLQRGFNIYRNVCQNCHWLKIPFRTLAQPGGPGFTLGQVTALAAEYKVQDGPNDAGDMFERAGRPADIIPWIYANENAAAASLGGKAPPQMQLLAKARSYERGFPWFVFDALPFFSYEEQGPDYIHALMTGYKEAPHGFQVPAGGHYNEYFPGHVIAMPPQLQPDLVAYPQGPDGKPPVPQTPDQYARDISAFLMWAAEPNLEARKRTGFMAIVFLAVFGAGMWYVKKKVWAPLGGEPEGLPGTAPLGPVG